MCAPRSYSVLFWHCSQSLTFFPSRTLSCILSLSLFFISSGVTQCLKMMNEQISTPEMAQIMKDFERENERAEVQQDMMNDAIDGAMDEGNQEAEDSMFNQVMDELGIDFSSSVPQASGTAVPGKAPAQAAPVATALGGAPSAGTDKNDKDGKDGGGDGGGGAPSGGGGGDPAMSELEARLNNLRR
jgi:charged multivesicular body protein 2A